MALETPVPRKTRPQVGEQAPPLSPLQERLAALLAEALVAEIRGLDVGPGVALDSARDARGDPENPQTPRAHPAPVRAPGRRPRDHGRQVGGGDAADPEDARDADPAGRREGDRKEED